MGSLTSQRQFPLSSPEFIIKSLSQTQGIIIKSKRMPEVYHFPNNLSLRHTESELNLQYTSNGKLYVRNFRFNKDGDGTDKGVFALDQKLNDLFDKVEDFVGYLELAANFKIVVSQQQVTLTLLSAHPTKKSQFINLHTINLPIVISSEKKQQIDDDLQEIIKACQQGDLSSLQVRKFFGTIAEVMKKGRFKQNEETIKEQKKEEQQNESEEQIEVNEEKIQKIENELTNESLERVIKKLSYLGDGLETLRQRVADLHQNMEQLKKSCISIDLSETITLLKVDLESQTNLTTFLQKTINQNAIDTELMIKKLQSAVEQQEKILCKFDKQAHLEQNEKDIMSQSILIMERQKGKEGKIQKMEKVKSAWDYVDSSSRFIKHFSIKGSRITKSSDFLFPTILIGLKPIRQFPTFVIKPKRMGILQSVYPGVCIGIIDSALSNKQSCSDGDNVIQYQCSGKLYNENKHIGTSGHGFGFRDFVRVRVDILRGFITWEINGVKACQIYAEKVQNEKIDWRPYVFMRDKGDSVDWIIQ